MTFLAGYALGALSFGGCSLFWVLYLRQGSLVQDKSGPMTTARPFLGKRKERLKPKHFTEEQIAAKEQKRPPTMHEWGD